MSDKLFTGDLQVTPFSSVVGSSVMLQMEGLGCVAILMISVPQIHFNYQQVSAAVIEALMQQTGGKLTLVLPDGFDDQTREALVKTRKEPR